MKVPEILAELTRLLQLEADEIAAYDAAVETVPAGPEQDELALFRLEHQRHALALHDVFMRLGQTPPEIRPDVKGVVIGALTPRSVTGLAAILDALRGNEQLSTSLYARASARPFPPLLRAQLERAHQDERNHLAWIERALARLAAGAGSHP